MPRHARLTALVAVALAVSACAGGSSPSPASTASTEATPTAPASPVATATPEPTLGPPTPPPGPTAFTSATYGYSITVPAGWTAIQATATWDGMGAPSHDVPEADQFVSPAAASAWVLAAPTTKDLDARVQESMDATTADHSDTCPPVPESQDAIQIGTEPGVLMEYNCGILINVAVAIHDGVAYLFGLRDPAVHAATSPEDRTTYLDLLASVTYPQ